MPLKVPAIHPLRLVASLLLAAAVAYGVYPYFQPVTFSYAKVRDGVVIESGSLLQEEHLEEEVLSLGRYFAGGNPVPGLIPWAEAASYLGLPVARRVSGGQPLLHSDLDMESDQMIGTAIQHDKTAMSIPVDDVIGVTPHLAIGDRVHVYASFEDGQGAHTGLLLRNMPIVALQREMEGEEPRLTAVTIALSEQEAVLLTHALHYGQVRLGQARMEAGDRTGIGDTAFAGALLKTNKRWNLDGEDQE